MNGCPAISPRYGPDRNSVPPNDIAAGTGRAAGFSSRPWIYALLAGKTAKLAAGRNPSGYEVMESGIAELIAAANAGDATSRQRLFARVYDELKRLARRQLAQNGASTLDTTGLVHEAYLKLVGADEIAVNNRAHVLALAGKAMREVLIDHARTRNAEKRGAGAATVAFDAVADVAGEGMSPEELLRLNDAIEIVANNEPRLLSLIELRVFAGLELAEISALQSVSERTLNRDWQRARARLFALMNTHD